MSESDESRLDEVLRQLDESPESVSQAFGKPASGTLDAYKASDDAERREFTAVNRQRRNRAFEGEKVEPSRIRPYPNVYLAKDGEPIEWVGFFHSEEAAKMWIKDQKGTFVILTGPRIEGLPMWQRAGKAHGRTS